MPLGSDLDLSFMLRDAGVSVVFNGETSSGILDMSDGYESLDQGGQLSVRYTSLLIATSAFANLRDRARIVVDGSPYVISGTPQREDDGKLLRCKIVAVP